MSFHYVFDYFNLYSVLLIWWRVTVKNPKQRIEVSTMVDLSMTNDDMLELKHQTMGLN
jgi:hypothetical protein